MTKWKDNGSNLVLNGDGFYVSFGAQERSPWRGTSLAPTSEGETAICTDMNILNPYFILDGDFRKVYESLVPLGLEACLSFYFDQPIDRRSSFTNRAKTRAELEALLKEVIQ